MELWDVFDEERNRLPRQTERGKRMRRGEYHLVVHVCLFDSEGRMLIQQRQADKEGWPGMWDITVGGAALSGETSRQAAEREMREELGIEIDLYGVRPHLTVQFEHGFNDIYLSQRDIDLSLLKLQREEVQAVAWATEEEIIRLMHEGIFIPYYESLIRLLFEMQGKAYGGIRKKGAI